MNLDALAAPPPVPAPAARRLLGLGLVIALHVALILALALGLGKQMVDVLSKPLVAKIIVAPKPPPPEAPPPPPPKLVVPPPPAYIPPPQIAVQAAPVVHHAIAVVTHVAPAPRPTPAPPPAQVTVPVPSTAPVIDAAHSCPQPKYPAMARRLEESGTVTLRFLIGIDGHVLSGTVAHGSGFKMLDTAALRALSQCRFKPGTVDGKPVQSWADIRYVWKLED